MLWRFLHSQLYGISAATLTNTELKNFCYACNNIFYKVFRSFDKNTILYCQWYCGFWPFELLYDYHRYNFLNKLVVADCLSNLSELDYPDYVEYVNIQCKYGIQERDSIAKIRYKLWKYFENLCLNWILLNQFKIIITSNLHQ